MTYGVIVGIEALLTFIAFCCSGYVHNCEISASGVCNFCHIIDSDTQISQILEYFVKYIIIIIAE